MGGSEGDGWGAKRSTSADSWKTISEGPPTSLFKKMIQTETAMTAAVQNKRIRPKQPSKTHNIFFDWESFSSTGYWPLL